MKFILSGIAFAAAVFAQAGPYERCGGKGWSGATTCVAGFTCTFSNDYYSQCAPLLNLNNGTRSSAYTQCGGRGWNGTTVCVDGYKCKFVNAWYSQCVLLNSAPGAAGAGSAPTTLVTSSGWARTSTEASFPTATRAPSNTTTTVTAPALTSTASASAAPTSTSAPSSTVPVSRDSKLKWLGVDESSAEFAPEMKPGVEGHDFRFPDEASIDGLIKEGYNIFRIPFLMERMAAPALTSPLQDKYLAGITQIVKLITKQGKHAIVDAHNYGRYNGEIITDTKAFQTFWKNVASTFRDDDKVIFDLNNEFYGLDQSLVLQLNQAGIDGVREAGAKTQYIMAEGNSYSGAWTWATVNDNLKNLVDPEDKLIYQMHQYFDTDGSGGSTECVSSTAGAERVASATKWLRDNNKVGVIGEFAGGANAQCKAAVESMLDHLEDNSDVWLGALWWGAGPWWSGYRYDFQAPDGIAYQYYDAVLKKYLA
ncbi:hypothetical protein E4U21_002393 [Claviceps maximensis]|nr:hypothetical protein E4U21_002393 [Claviceps maximensis]